jgi:serine/threonine-protein kinase HipA
LFGVFNDSLPDGWGRLLIDRKLMKLGMNPGGLSPLERLCYVGSRGMGALIYEPEIPEQPYQQTVNLDEIADDVLQFQEYEDDRFVDDLLSLGGSSAGARPKIVVRLGNDDWIIKFRSLMDPKDIGPIEHAYHLMAIEAKLDVPEAKLFPSRKGPEYFGVKRFDRVGDNRYHMHTLSGLLHADHREPTLDYETMMKACAWLTKDVRECEKLFRTAVFNVLSHNRDDHAKNFSFLMDENGSWSVSPSYDLTFSSGPSGEHCSMVMGEGKNPKRLHLLRLAEIGSIKKSKALQIINEVEDAVSKWQHFAKESGVSAASLKRIRMAIEQIKNGL